MSISKRAPVVLTEYNPRWPLMFAAERDFLIQTLSACLHGTIEHVGSTAVPGLTAKPVIDIMFGIASLDAARPAIEVLSANGYQYFPYKTDLMHWFCKPSDAFRTHHLHLIPYQSPLWNERIAFRDLLREDPGLAQEYQALKVSLAVRYRDDREAYTEAKWPFIQRALARNTAP